MPTILKAKISIQPSGAAISTFAAPAGFVRTESEAQPSLAFAGLARTSGVRSFVLDAMGHLRLGVRVNGVEADAILDTGAGRTVLDQAFAHRLGLTARPGFQVAGITGSTQGGWAEPIELTIGDLTLTRLKTGLLDLHTPTGEAGRSADLLIGRELFERVIADFDFTRFTVSFREPSLHAMPAASFIAPLGLTPGGTPYVSIALNGRPPIHAALDIGYNGALMVSPAYADAAGLFEGRRASTVASAGAEGISLNRITTCDGLEFAGCALRDAPLESPPAWNYTVPAILGLDVLRRFRMMTEFSRQRVGFIPDLDLLATPLPKDRSGIGARPTAKGLLIVHVAQASPAEAAGLQAGEIISRINGERADLDYVRDHPRMGAGPAGMRYLLQIDDSRTVPLTLADYY